MEVIKKLPPGAPGTKRFMKEYGEDLVCVRYRHDSKKNRRLTTIEVIVAERPMLNVSAEAAIEEP